MFNSFLLVMKATILLSLLKRMNEEQCFNIPLFSFRDERDYPYITTKANERKTKLQDKTVSFFSFRDECAYPSITTNANE
jgi:hypothetical protein